MPIPGLAWEDGRNVSDQRIDPCQTRGAEHQFSANLRENKAAESGPPKEGEQLFVLRESCFMVKINSS